MKYGIIITLCFFIFFNIVGCNVDKIVLESETMTIGAILPLSGVNAQYGAWIKNAFEMAREEINVQGGVRGEKLGIVYEDDQADPKIATDAMMKLVEVENVPLVFGSWASSCVLAQAPIAESTKTPVLAEAQSPKIREAGDYIFRIQPDSRYYLNFLVPYIFDNLDVRKLAILYVNNDYGLDQADVFEKQFRELGGEVLFKEGFDQGAIDFKTQLVKIKELKPEAVFMPAYVEAGYILKQAREIEFETQFIGSVPMENSDILKIAQDAADGVIYPHHFDPDLDKQEVRDFMDKYYQKYEEYPEGFAALAYDAMYAIAHVLGRCGENKECIKDELYKVQDFPGVTGMTSFDDHGDVIKPIVIRVVKDGRFITIWRPNE